MTQAEAEASVLRNTERAHMTRTFWIEVVLPWSLVAALLAGVFLTMWFTVSPLHSCAAACTAGRDNLTGPPIVRGMESYDEVTKVCRCRP